MLSSILQCIYALGGGELLLIENYQELVKHGFTPEQEIVTRHFCYFGPIPEGLLKYINSDLWSTALKEASALVEDAVSHQPELGFDSGRVVVRWSSEVAAKNNSNFLALVCTGIFA